MLHVVWHLQDPSEVIESINVKKQAKYQNHTEMKYYVVAGAT